MERIWFQSPAKDWCRALPIGNGRLGAMVFGGQEREILQMNQDSIWYGGPVNRINPEAKAHLEEVRGLIEDEKIPEAENLLRYAFSGIPQSQRPYQTLGNAEITYYGQQGQMSEYSRELDLADGIVREIFYLNGNKIKKEYLASYPHGVIAVHIKAEKSCISLDGLLRRGRYYDHSGKLDHQTIFMDGTLGQGGVSFLTGMRAQVSGGAVSTIGEHLRVRNAREVTLYISCETSFYCTDYRKEAERRLDEVCKAGYELIKQLHRDDYRKLYGDVGLDLEGAAGDLPVEELLERTGEEPYDKRTAELYFRYGRYLLISSSRPGSLPANLQGIWNDEMTPPWDSKYTININMQMNYWPAEICSLPQCHLPLFDHLFRMWKNGRETAERMYGCRGFAAHHNTDLWGDCAPQDIYTPATYWVMGGAWLCTHIWIHYAYTGDRDFLKKMYPLLKDAVLFFHDYLIEVNGKLVTCPSVSPENTYILPSGVQGSVCAGASMDIQILRDLIEGYLKSSNVLGIQDETLKCTETILSKLPDIRIGKYGQIMEWGQDYEEQEPGHRHISQLYALHPSHQITVDKTPKLAHAALKTLERRLAYGGGHTGWSCAWIVNLYARLGKGDKALENLTKLWKESTYPNFMDTHPYRGGYVFQIDGNLGATAAIAEMLVQSDGDRVLLLPALPVQWKNGKISGITVYGGFRISLEWKEGNLVCCAIEGDRAGRVLLVYREKRKWVMVPAGKKFLWTKEAGDFLEAEGKVE